jgi:hypothetical protein
MGRGHKAVIGHPKSPKKPLILRTKKTAAGFARWFPKKRQRDYASPLLGERNKGEGEPQHKTARCKMLIGTNY